MRYTSLCIKAMTGFMWLGLTACADDGSSLPHNEALGTPISAL